LPERAPNSRIRLHAYWPSLTAHLVSNPHQYVGTAYRHQNMGSLGPHQEWAHETEPRHQVVLVSHMRALLRRLTSLAVVVAALAIAGGAGVRPF
jgi:hypothetical protein